MQPTDPTKFTEQAWDAIIKSQDVARRSSNQQLEVEHVAIALLEQQDSAPKILVRVGVDIETLTRQLQDFTKRQPRLDRVVDLYLGRGLDVLLDRADAARETWQDPIIGVDHLILALSEDDRIGRRLLKAFNFDRSQLEAAIKQLRSTTTPKATTTQAPEVSGEALPKYGKDLTEAARAGKMDPVIGRDEEIRRVVQVLSRRQKNNPVLIGEPGVGKTAIAEGLAQRIVNGDVPESLKDRTLISLDMGSLIAGAKLRGEFEERLRSVLKEVTESAGQIVLFIDELHTVVGAGGNQGAMDASNLLKPMLARGELRCIGATTIDEYRKYIEKDPALERRFQPVQVNEPSVEDTISILRGLKERYEVHHGVKISDSALVSAATLSSRYIADRFLPDKAIDLVDEAAAKLKMEITSKPAELESIDRRVMQLEMEKLSLGDETLNSDSHRPTQERLEKIGTEITILKVKQTELTNQWQGEKQLLDGIKSLREQEEQLKVQSEQAERAGEIATVGRIQYGEIPKLQKERSVKESQLAEVQVQGSTLLREQVSENDIAEIVAKWTGIPVNRLLASERQKLLQLESHLHHRVIGQHEAVSAVSAAIRRARAGMQDPNRPIGSFLFMGPTGVGKTELARALAEFLFDSDEAMVRLDMSEYMEKHAVSRLIGAPPGYVGHEDGGQLTEAVRRHPYSVVLFDEIEKAHPDVFNILLQVLDDGRITDSKGKTVSFCNTVIVMTSNIASEQIITTLLNPHRDNTQTNDLREQVTNTLRTHFRPEFIQRIDELTIFEPLKKTELRQIVTIQIHRIEQMLADQKIKIQLSTAAQDYLADVGYDPIYGVRPLKRAIQRELQNPIATKILETTFEEGDTIFVDCEDRLLTFNKQPLKAKKLTPAIIPEVVLSTVTVEK
ncbi:ATP-dependent chaperone ClpB [Chamaesiphon sp. VAR_48_metabat_135_sub]|uniref:ATP-dependent chaperone ClpB n=1 Tax=Chamaesiphon sp. VAR_48_metabat_135_sub TaxID=2964699 RepID=UPI00286A775A|nr:ATP-dependent chaperone ClpB [Chamaesiphon sp. VAR_48_metabat_135_sub]